MHRASQHLRVEPSSSSRATTRRRIVLAARRQFLTHGFRGVTMDDLAAALGMSKKTLYGCFPSKEALLKAVLRDKFADIERDLRQITRNGAAVPTTIHQLLACVQRHTEEIQPPFVRDIQREAPDLFAIVERRRRVILQRYFGHVFQRARRAGLMRRDLPVTLVVEILLAAVSGVLNPPKMAELGITPKTGFSAIITIMLDGVMTRRGRTP